MWSHMENMEENSEKYIKNTEENSETIGKILKKLWNDMDKREQRQVK
jgi:cytochrome c556